MDLKTALDLRPKLKALRKQRALFVIIPVRWIWFQVGFMVFFLLGAGFAGFWFGAGELDRRAKEAVASYFEQLQSGMTRSELDLRIKSIREASDKLRSNDPIATLARHERWLSFCSNSIGRPTAATAGLFPDRVLILWTRVQVNRQGSLDSDFRYAVYRRTMGEQGRGSEIGQVTGSESSFWDKSPERGVRYQYRVYRYPSNPAGKPDSATDHVWLVAETYSADGWVEGWAE